MRAALEHFVAHMGDNAVVLQAVQQKVSAVTAVVGINQKVGKADRTMIGKPF